MSDRDRLTVAAAVAVMLGCAALVPMYQELDWVLPTLGAVLVVAVTGAAARRARLPVLLVPALQVGAVLLYAAVLLLPGALGSLTDLREGARTLLGEAAVAVEELAAPVPTRPELVLLAVLGAGAVATLVDLAAVGLRRAALAGLPLLVLLAVPSGLVRGGLGWWPFTLGACGWLLLLVQEGRTRVEGWGTAVRPAPHGTVDADPDPPSGRVGRRIGAAALGVAVLVPALLPGLDSRLLPGTGGGGVDGEASTITYNPITRLQGQLLEPEPQEILRYTSTDSAPDYLRLTTLDRFDGGSWQSGSLSGDPVSDGIPTAIGSGEAPTREVEVQARLSGLLDSQWLPVPASPSEVDVEGRWLWDRESETVFSVRANTSRLQEYRTTVERVLPEAALLGEGRPVAPAVEPYTTLPEVAPEVTRLTERITAGGTTPYAKAVLLQEFFRDRSNGFVYDLRTAPFAGQDALVAFLRNRRGFCEQYASAMGAMLRIAGIPARVAVGFTPGTADPSGTRVVTTADAHAWPEAWFDGAGWVRFEPTPTGDGRTDVPGYTEQTVPEDGEGATPEASAAPVPSAGPETDAAGRDLDLLDRAGDSGSTATETGTSAATALRGVALTLGVLTLLALPATLGAWRRRRRWRSPGPLAAWAQLQEDAQDLGLRWRGADSPRAAARRLQTLVPLSSVAQDALGRVALAAERARYARPGSVQDVDPGSLRADAVLVREGLEAHTPWGLRARARLAPPSALQAAARRTGGLVADLLDGIDRVLALPQVLRRRIG